MKTLFAATLLAASLAGFGAANAMPAASISSVGADVIQVAGGCGPGFHRGPYGGCVRNRGVVVRRPMVAPGVVVVRPRAVRKCRYWGPNRVCRTYW